MEDLKRIWQYMLENDSWSQWLDPRNLLPAIWNVLMQAITAMRDEPRAVIINILVVTVAYGWILFIAVAPETARDLTIDFTQKRLLQFRSASKFERRVKLPMLLISGMLAALATDYAAPALINMLDPTSTTMTLPMAIKVIWQSTPSTIPLCALIYITACTLGAVTGWYRYARSQRQPATTWK